MALSFPSRQNLGQNLDLIGTFLGLPETGWSERIAGGNTMNSQNYINNARAAENPTYEAPYNVSAQLGPGNYAGAVEFRNQQNTTNNNPLPQNQNTNNSAPSPAPTNLRDPNARPGSDWWWDAADGWKQAGGGSSEVDAQVARIRDTINSGYDSYLGRLGGMIPEYENQQNTQLQSAADIYKNIIAGLGQTKDTALGNLGTARKQVQSNVSNSTADLQQNLQGVIRNTGMQLGAMGAGDTSAARVMAPYAYTKLAGQEYGKIQRQGNDQLFQIETQERDTQNQYDQMVNQTEIEKEQQFQQIRNQFGQIISNIRQQMANAPVERANALAALEQNVLSQAQQRLANIENNYMQMQSDLSNWAQNRMAQLNDAKIQLSGKANFNPQDIVFQELQARNMVNSTPDSSAYWNPEIMKKRREEYGF